MDRKQVVALLLLLLLFIATIAQVQASDDAQKTDEDGDGRNDNSSWGCPDDDFKVADDEFDRHTSLDYGGYY